MASADRRLNVAIVSGGWGVVAHLPAWRLLANKVQVVGIMTSREETATAAARAHEIPRAYWDIDALCADPDIDIVDVGTQPRIRQALVAAVLAAGKHCYSGMPFATDTAWSRRLLDAQQAAGVVGAVDATIQAVPAVARMKELIDEGAIGDIWFAQTRFNQQLFNQPPAGWPYKWFAEERSGASALRNLGAHALHVLVHMLGPVHEAIGQNQRFLDRWTFADGDVIEPATPDTAMALLKFRSGALASLTTSWVAADAAGWSLEVHGSRGRLLAEGTAFPTAQGTRLYQGDVGSGYVPVGHWVEVPERLRTLPGSLLDPDWPDKDQAARRATGPQDLVMGRLFRAMIGAIETGAQAQPGFAQAHHVQHVVDAIIRSDGSRSWETVDD